MSLSRAVVFAAVGVLVLGSESWGDVELFDVFKSRIYVQSNDGMPPAPVAYNLESYVDNTVAGEIGSVTLNGMLYDELDPVTWDFVRSFGTQAELDAAYPTPGVFTIVVSGGTLGTLTETASLPADNYPAAPALTSETITGLDGADPTSNLSLEWNPVGASFTVLNVVDLDNDNDVVDDEFVIGTSFEIDSSALSPMTTYRIELIVGNGGFVPGTDVGGFGAAAESFQGFLAITVVEFTTGVTPAPTDFDAGVLKGVGYTQLIDNTPPTQNEFWGFEAFFDPGPGAIGMGTVFGGAMPADLMEFGSGVWDIDDVHFGSKAALDAAYPSSMTYTMNVSGGSLGARSQDFALGADNYPAPAYLSGTVLSDIQGMDPSLPFMLEWVIPGGSVDAVAIGIDRLSDFEKVYEEILPSGGTTQFEIPAGTLEPGESYEFFVTLVNGTIVPGDPFPGFGTDTGILTGFLTDTLFTFSTAPAACVGDLDGSGSLDFGDVSSFLTAFAFGDLAVDFDGSGSLDFGDVSAFLGLFAGGCP